MCISLMLFIYLINEKHDCVSGGSVAQRAVSHKSTDIGIMASVKHILNYYNIPFTFLGEYSLPTFKHLTQMPKLGGLSPQMPCIVEGVREAPPESNSDCQLGFCSELSSGGASSTLNAVLCYSLHLFLGNKTDLIDLHPSMLVLALCFYISPLLVPVQLLMWWHCQLGW